MRQRIMLASVMLLKPALLIADEPTTALDAMVQREVMELMVGLAGERGHRGTDDQPRSAHGRPLRRPGVIVMSKGAIVEQGATVEGSRPGPEAYTRKLLASMPRRASALPVPQEGRPIVEVRGLIVDYRAGGGGFRKADREARAARHRPRPAAPAKCVALVGGTGSGKTTLGRAIRG